MYLTAGEVLEKVSVNRGVSISTTTFFNRWV